MTSGSRASAWTASNSSWPWGERLSEFAWRPERRPEVSLEGFLIRKLGAPSSSKALTRDLGLLLPSFRRELRDVRSTDPFALGPRLSGRCLRARAKRNYPLGRSQLCRDIHRLKLLRQLPRLGLRPPRRREDRKSV